MERIIASIVVHVIARRSITIFRRFPWRLTFTALEICQKSFVWVFGIFAHNHLLRSTKNFKSQSLQHSLFVFQLSFFVIRRSPVWPNMPQNFGSHELGGS